MRSNESHSAYEPVPPPFGEKIFFYWDGPKISAQYRRNMRYIQLMHPDREVVLVSDDEVVPLIERIAPHRVDLYRKIAIPAARSDIARMALLHAHGGWYLDCDCRPRCGLEHWEEPGKTLAFNWTTDKRGKRSITNAFVGGAAGHPYFRRAVELALSLLAERLAIRSVYRSTGPIAALSAAGPFLRDPGTLLHEMDYGLVDVPADDTKGAWRYQECVGIWFDERNPPRFVGEVAIERLEPVEAYRYYRDVFDRFPETRDRNYRAMLLRAGIPWMRKHGLMDEITGLILDYVPLHEHSDFAARLTDFLRKQNKDHLLERVTQRVDADS